MLFEQELEHELPAVPWELVVLCAVGEPIVVGDGFAAGLEEPDEHVAEPVWVEVDVPRASSPYRRGS